MMHKSQEACIMDHSCLRSWAATWGRPYTCPLPTGRSKQRPYSHGRPHGAAPTFIH